MFSFTLLPFAKPVGGPIGRPDIIPIPGPVFEPAGAPIDSLGRARHVIRGF